MAKQNRKLTAKQAQLLSVIRHLQPTTGTDIARFLGLSRSAVNSRIWGEFGALKHGWVVSDAGRTKTIRLTKEGRQAVRFVTLSLDSRAVCRRVENVPLAVF